MLHRLLRNSRPVRARIAARLARPCVGAFWRPVTRRGYHCRGQPGSAKGKPALVDRQNRRWLPGRFVVAGFGAVSKKCCLLRWDRGFESVFLQRGVTCELDFLDHGAELGYRVPDYGATRPVTVPRSGPSRVGWTSIYHEARLLSPRVFPRRPGHHRSLRARFEPLQGGNDRIQFLAALSSRSHANPQEKPASALARGAPRMRVVR